MAFKKKKEDVYFVMFRDFAKAISAMGENFGTIINNYHNIERAVADMKIAEALETTLDQIFFRKGV